MFPKVMMLLGPPAHALLVQATLRSVLHGSPEMQGHPVIAQASLGIPDTLFIFVVALVVFGPKRLPEIGRQIGKLMFEFRRASNDFKLQIEEELRLSEQQEKLKQQQLMTAAASKAEPAPVVIPAITAESTPVEKTETTLVVQPPSSGEQVVARPPNRIADEAPAAVNGSGARESLTIEPEQGSPAESAAAHHG